MPWIGSGEDVQWVDDAVYASLARPANSLPAGVQAFQVNDGGFEGQGGLSTSYMIDGTPLDKFTSEVTGTASNGRPGGMTLNPFTGQRERSFWANGIDKPLPESVAKRLDPNAQEYFMPADGGYGGFGGFLEQMMVPALMAGVGAAGFAGLGGAAANAGFGSAGVPDALSTFGGGSFGGGGMELNALPSWLNEGFSYNPLDSLGGSYMPDTSLMDMSTMLNSSGGASPINWAAEYGLSPATASSIGSIIKEYGPTVAKSVVTANGGDGSLVDKLLSNPALLGAGLGALGGALGGSSQAGTMTSVTDIPDWLKPYAMNSLNRASTMFDQMDTSNPLLPAAQSQMMKTIQGDYLSPDSNPYLKGTFDRAAGEIQSKLSPSFGHMQAFGSNTGWQQAYGRSLADLSTSLYGGNYQTERGRQLGAAGQAPSFTTGSYESKFAPFSQFQNLLKFGGSQTSSPFYENRLGNAIGGAITGYGLGRVFK